MDGLEAFEVTRGRVIPGGAVLHLDDGLALRRELPPPGGYDVDVDVAFPGSEGFAGIAFAARAPGWHELVYVSAGGEVQYDPVMNGSNTWQLYPELRASSSPIRGRWARLRLQVRAEGAAAFLDGGAAPVLVIRPLRTGGLGGRVGVWGYLPCAVRGFSVTPADAPLPCGPPAPPLPAGLLTAWRTASGQPLPTEASGVLNLNRHLPYRAGAEAEVHTTIAAPSATAAILHLGYSDHLRLWLNGALVHEGANRWDPPRSDGRVLPATTVMAVRLHPGANELRARLTAAEAFGWGLVVSARWPAPSPAG